MPKPRVLVASVTAASPTVLAAHLATVRTAASRSEAEVAFYYLADPTAQNLSGITDALEAANIPYSFADDKPAGANYAVSDHTHHWTENAFYWLGAQKEHLIEYARRERYDYLMLVDSDLLLGPDTLASMLACEKPVVSAVFWTRWTPDQPALPQVWRTHPYGFDGMGEQGHEFLRRLEQRELVRVRGLGACTLIRADALQKVSFRPIEGLPREGMWQGEDRAFCLNAEAAHVELWADGWPDIMHLYRPADAEHIPGVMYEFTEQSVPCAVKFGYMVSLKLEPLEEPSLAGHAEHIRGRLGQLRLLPDIEDAILSMRVGEDRFVAVTFPVWYPIDQYRGQKRLVRVRLLGAKPFRRPLPDGLTAGVVEA